MNLPRRDAMGRFVSNKTGPTKKLVKVKRKTSSIATHIYFILDRSGSMSGCSKEAVDGFNGFIQEQCKVQPDAEFTLNLFDHEHIIKRWDKVTEVEKLRNNDTHSYYARGTTALYDAIGLTVDPVVTNPHHRYLVIILTDGYENASRRWSLGKIKDLIAQRQNMGNWTFVYMGSNHDAWLAAGSIGIDRGNTMSYDYSKTGDAVMTASCSTYSFGASPTMSTRSFFTTDLSGLTKKDVSKLKDLSGSVKTWQVEREVEIQPFVESKGIVYSPGNAFYQLTKKETIQPYKEMMVMQKGTKRVFGGQDARNVLGLPSGTVKVTPGNHADWDVFVQSHSTNRKLVRGTRLIYRIV